MKKVLLRNVAIVTLVFIVTLSIMLITNYFQVREATPLQAEVVETLKQLNDANADNPVLQEQIRQLDLMARKAYFIRHDHLMAGLYILIGMFAVFILCVRLYYADSKSIPNKKLDPVDEWVIQSNARKYITWGAVGLAAIALLFVILSSPYLQTEKRGEDVSQGVVADGTGDIPSSNPVSGTTEPENSMGTPTENQTDEPEEPILAETATDSVPATETVVQPVVQRVNHNAFRGNNSNGISAARDVPVKWDVKSGRNIAWRQEIPLHGYSSPVLNGNKVFITGADETTRELYCYDLATGEMLWRLPAANIPGSPAQAPKTTEDTGLAASSVATNGEQVCAIFATGDIICADMEGNRLWAKNLGVPENHYGYASSLLMHGNRVIVQYDNSNAPKVIALNAANGNEYWNKGRQEKITWSSPMITTINNIPQLVLMGNPGITSYNVNTGEQIWRVTAMSGEVGASACSANGIVFGASEYAKLVAINGTDGSVLWESTEYLPEISSPVATEKRVYIATSYGVFAAFDAKTGELKKEHELSAQFYSSPMIVDGKLYLLCTEGKMFIFSTGDDFNLIDSFDTGERTFATPAFTDGKIVVRTENSIYCVASN